MCKLVGLVYLCELLELTFVWVLMEHLLHMNKIVSRNNP